MFNAEQMRKFHGDAIGYPPDRHDPLSPVMREIYDRMAQAVNEQMEAETKQWRELVQEMADFFKYDPPFLVGPLREWQAERDALIARANEMLKGEPQCDR